MFKIFVFFISLSTGQIEDVSTTTSTFTKERCEFILAHDLPILKERAEVVAPGQYELQGYCISEPGQDA